MYCKTKSKGGNCNETSMACTGGKRENKYVKYVWCHSTNKEFHTSLRLGTDSKSIQLYGLKHLLQPVVEISMVVKAFRFLLPNYFKSKNPKAPTTIEISTGFSKPSHLHRSLTILILLSKSITEKSHFRKQYSNQKDH